MKKLLPILSVAVFMGSCYYDNVDEMYPGVGVFNNCDTSGVITYSGDISTIIRNNCLNCHSGPNPSGSISLDGWTNVNGVATSGLLLDATWHNPGTTPMPPNFQLDSCQLIQIKKWIDAGAPNN